MGEGAIARVEKGRGVFELSITNCQAIVSKKTFNGL
ncbi:hypothetical protein SDC9_43704 [bioreactor metagenome]|uniref:Uncharacterized protein n=1 Tax=bioreactor metagenome TaxID=1076179 RepID=A0A644W500_9ZZZZ